MRSVHRYYWEDRKLQNVARCCKSVLWASAQGELQMFRYMRWCWLIGLIALLAVACSDDEAGTTIGDNDGDNAEQNADDGEPILQVSGEEALSWQLDIDAVGTAQFEVSNIGEGILEFDITADDWLVLEPADGRAEADETVVIDAEASCYEKIYQMEATSTVSITSNGGDYEFDAHIICGEVPPGMLEILVEGLPDTQDASITVEGPGDFYEEITETQYFDEAPVGSYTIRAESVGGDRIYEPLTEEFLVGVERESVTSVTVEYELVPGAVLVEVEGLPAGAEPNLTLVRGADEWDVPSDGLIEDLEPANYTVIAEDYEEDGVMYEASDTAVTVVSDEVTEVTIIYLVDAAYLVIDVQGLPSGTDHDIDVVADSDGAATAVPQTGELTLLPDTYEIVPHEVEVGPAIYEAVGLSVELESGVTTEVEIVYELIPAQLPVIVSGLPTGVDADVDIVGGQDSVHITESETVELIPDSYEVEVHSVVDGVATYSAAPGTPDQVDVYSGVNDALEIEYEVIGGDIIVLIEEIGEVDYQVELVGPDGFQEPLVGDTSFSGAPVGEYQVVVVETPVDPYGNDSYIDIAPANFELENNDEQIVDIVVRAAYIVINEDDSGEGSLRFVVDDVIDGTIIEFVNEVSEIILTSGMIEVAKDIAIDGGLDDPVAVNGNASSRIFEIAGGGRLAITDLVMRNGFGDPGGAIRVVDNGYLSVGRSVFEDNLSAQAGGAISVADEATLEIYDTLFAGNTADGWGSAIDAPQDHDVYVTIRRSLFRDNEAGGNGGAVDTSGTLEISDTTFFNNHSAGRVAAVMVFAGTAVLERLTVVQNSIDGGGGPGGPDFDETAGIYVNWGAEATIRSNIVVDNDGGDLGGTVENFVSQGFNVVGEVDDEFEAAPTDQLDVDDAGLEALADNGGYTQTMALTENSTARTLKFGTECSENTVLFRFEDQRGEHRPAGGFCSAGAYEVDATVETFDGADMSRTTFEDSVDSFTGVAGLQWDYYRVKRQEEEGGDPDAIDGTTVVLDGDAGGWIAAQDVPDGISSISMMLAPADNGAGPRHVEVVVDGVSVGISPDVSDQTEPQLFAIELGEAVEGPFDLTIESAGSYQIAVDNVSWR